MLQCTHGVLSREALGLSGCKAELEPVVSPVFCVTPPVLTPTCIRHWAASGTGRKKAAVYQGLLRVCLCRKKFAGIVNVHDRHAEYEHIDMNYTNIAQYIHMGNHQDFC